VETLKGLDGMLAKVIQGQERDENFEFSSNEIKDTIKNIQQEEKNLNLFIDNNKIDTININYEEIIDNREYIYNISNILNIEDIVLLKRRLKKISGEKSLEWVKLFNQQIGE
jgi:LPS sulfotransferase NodH